MKTDLFDYHLPPDRIAQHSVEPRDHAKLLVLNRKMQTLQDKRVYDLPDLLEPDDLLVFNDSKVFKARLRTDQGELFLLRPDGDAWLALAKPGKKIKIGGGLRLTDESTVKILQKYPDGTIRVDFSKTPDEVFALTDRLGEVPTPPYVKEEHKAERYQTIYARETGSVAAPTAGFHFTQELFRRLEEKGIRKAFVTLHVGLGTFRPMKTETLEEHEMHSEWCSVPTETLAMIEETKRAGHRVIAAGTTSVRALESAALTKPPGFTKLFIKPGFHFQVIDGLMTNFHLPKSTLLVLVSAFAGREFILHAYQHAIDNGYRFYSFGDAMLIV